MNVLKNLFKLKGIGLYFYGINCWSKKEKPMSLFTNEKNMYISTVIILIIIIITDGARSEY